MVQLDDVFTRSAKVGNEHANYTVANEIRTMSQVQLEKMFEIQQELALLQNLKDLPQELTKLVKRGMTKLLQKSGDDFVVKDIEKQEKPRKQKKQKKNDIFDIDGQFEKIQELEGKNELLTLEIQKLKMDFASKEREKAQTLNMVDDRDEEINSLKLEIDGVRHQVQKQQKIINSLEEDIQIQCEKANRLSICNEELRDLFEQERTATNEEFRKLELTMEQNKKMHDRKLSMIKAKLYVIVSSFFVGKDSRIDKESSIDDMCKTL